MSHRSYQEQRLAARRDLAARHWRRDVILVLCAFPLFVASLILLVLTVAIPHNVLMLLLGLSLAVLVFSCREVSVLRKGRWLQFGVKVVLCYGSLIAYLGIHAGRYDILDWLIIGVLILFPLTDLWALAKK